MLVHSTKTGTPEIPPCFSHENLFARVSLPAPIDWLRDNRTLHQQRPKLGLARHSSPTQKHMDGAMETEADAEGPRCE